MMGVNDDFMNLVDFCEIGREAMKKFGLQKEFESVDT